LILEEFHGVAADHVGLYIVPFAIGNFLGPVVLGPSFDRWGRRVTIPLTTRCRGCCSWRPGASSSPVR
jgi:MFS family permease